MTYKDFYAQAMLKLVANLLLPSKKDRAQGRETHSGESRLGASQLALALNRVAARGKKPPPPHAPENVPRPPITVLIRYAIRASLCAIFEHTEEASGG